jgi:DNA polymerase III alpha subunit
VRRDLMVHTRIRQLAQSLAGLIQSLSKHRAGVVAAPLPVMP